MHRAHVVLDRLELPGGHARVRGVLAVSDGSGVVVHEVVADGSVWHGKEQQSPNANGVLVNEFNTDEIVKFPGAVALIWRWTGDNAFRDEMLDFTRRNLEYVRRSSTRTETAGRRATATSSARAWARRSSTTPSTTSAACTTTPTWRGRPARRRAPTRPRRGPTRWRARFEAAWWIEAEQQYADSLRDPGDVKINQKHWIGVDPMEAELFRDGEFVPGLAAYDNGSRALATRENNCYSGERPGNRGLFHTGCGGGPAGAGEFADLLAQHRRPGGRRGQLRASRHQQQRRYTDANAETQFSQPATGGTPDEQPGAMPEIMPSLAPDGTVGTPPNIDRCWTCRSMFMQAWGNYGTAWPVVHQQLGVRPHLGHDWLEVVPQVPDGQTSVGAEDIRLGDGSADGRRDPRGHALHDHHRHARGAGARRSASATPCRAARPSARCSSTADRAPTSRGRPTAASRCGSRRPRTGATRSSSSRPADEPRHPGTATAVPGPARR